MPAPRVMLDFPDADGRPVRLCFPPAGRILAAAALSDVRAVLRGAEQAAREGAWVAGFIAYEAAPAFDPALVVRSGGTPTPLAWFAVSGPPERAPRPAASADPPALAWTADVGRAGYEDAIRSIRAAIAAGDVYQVNHTLRLAARCAVPVSDWYDTVVAQGHGRYCALIETDEWTVLSASPELFIDLRGDTVTARPMKGTARRGRWLEEDRAARDRLADSVKDRAENLMIVDLLRNDLGRIARFGSVAVPAMFAIETYPTVLQMTSTITAERRHDVSIDDVFAAAFPCGSVTGAPKVTAMRSIAVLEASPRGPYCGAIGVLRPDGSATFNVAIRTLLIDRVRGCASYGAGGGITWDSDATAEYDEAISKAALLHQRTPPFRLLETMRLHEGALVRLERHLARLAASAEYWGFCSATAVNARDALLRTASAAPHGVWRLRLLASRDGTIEIEPSQLNEDELPQARDAQHERTAAIADAPIDGSDRLLCHKTTARVVYDAHRAVRPDAFDVLLHDDRGCITEFCTGNCVVLLEGALVTPPRRHGLLAGTFRDELLERGEIEERSLTIEDVRRAEAVWLINSVREWVRVHLTP